MRRTIEKKKWCEYPYLVGKRDEFTVMPDGRTVVHQRFGTGTVVGYKVAFKDSEVHFSLDDFHKGTINLVTRMESD